MVDDYFMPHEFDRDFSFELNSAHDGVSLYGGFSGGEADPSERDPDNLTVLSGDLQQDDNGNIDPSEATRQDNSYRVLNITSGATNITIDGFEIRSGNANGAITEGAGIYIDQVDPYLRNVILASNTATGAGGGVYLNSADPIFVRTEFTENVSSGSAGAVFSVSSGAKFYNSFFGTSSGSSGGAFYISGSTSDFLITNSVFENNDGNLGGAIFVWGGTGAALSIINNTFVSNNAATDGGAINIGSSGGQITAVIRNNILWNNQAPTNPEFSFAGIDASAADIDYNLISTGPIGMNGTDQDPMFVDPGFSDYSLTSGSAAINGGDTNSLPTDDGDLDEDMDTGEAVPLDADGKARVEQGIVDIGAFEFDEVNATDPGNAVVFDGSDDVIIMNEVSNDNFLRALPARWARARRARAGCAAALRIR